MKKIGYSKMEKKKMIFLEFSKIEKNKMLIIRNELKFLIPKQDICFSYTFFITYLNIKQIPIFKTEIDNFKSRIETIS